MPPTERHIHSRLALYGRGANLGNTLEGEELIKKMTAYIKKQVKENNRAFVGIARGDVVILDTDAGYRNNGKFIWDGKKVIGLYTEVDDYGSLPPEIEIADDNDFEPDSWEDLIDHNEYIWYSPEIRTRLYNSLLERRNGRIRTVIEGNVNIRGTQWTFTYEGNGMDADEPLTLDDALRAIKESRTLFIPNTSRSQPHKISMYSSDTAYGKALKIPGATRGRTAATAATATPPARTAAEDPARVQRVAEIARIEGELRAARESVAELERQLAEARVGGGKAKSNKK
jgi:hypothetical protein